MANDQRKMCIVLDTNIWLSDHLLRAHLGASLLHAVLQLKAVIGFPEVVEKELETNWKRRSKELLEEAQKASRTLEIMIGETPIGGTLPEIQELSDAYTQRIKELDAHIHRVALTLEHAKRALDRAIAHQPPCGKNNEQFRDALIWEAVLDLAANYDVHFITNDASFFAERKSANPALAENLANECKMVAGSLACYRSVEHCLTALEQEIKEPIEATVSARKIVEIIHDRLSKALAMAEFELGELTNSEIKAFETGRPTFALSFQLVFALRSRRDPDPDRQNPRLMVKGDCTLDPKSYVVSDVGLGPLDINWRDEAGKTHRARQQDPWRMQFPSEGLNLFRDTKPQYDSMLRYLLQQLEDTQAQWEEY